MGLIVTEVQKMHHGWTVRTEMMTAVSFSPSAPAVTASNAGTMGMTGECCQISWSVTRSSWRISRTPLSCLPLILPLPIIVNQSVIVSEGGSCMANDCQGSGVRREACRMPARKPIYQHGGHQGPLSRGCLGRMPHVQARPFCLATQSAQD